MDSSHWYHNGPWRRLRDTIMAVVKVLDKKESLPPVIRVNGKTHRIKK
jgi:hypothetical protein